MDSSYFFKHVLFYVVTTHAQYFVPFVSIGLTDLSILKIRYTQRIYSLPLQKQPNPLKRHELSAKIEEAIFIHLWET